MFLLPFNDINIVCLDSFQRLVEHIIIIKYTYTYNTNTLISGADTYLPTDIIHYSNYNYDIINKLL